MPSNTPITVCEALRLIWEADRYPILGNEDVRVSILMEKEALAKATAAVPSPDDPPEFSRWLVGFLDPNLPGNEREELVWALYDLFDPDTGPATDPPRVRHRLPTGSGRYAARRRTGTSSGRLRRLGTAPHRRLDRPDSEATRRNEPKSSGAGPGELAVRPSTGRIVSRDRGGGLAEPLSCPGVSVCCEKAEANT
jgi:hypothetical protein